MDHHDFDEYAEPRDGAAADTAALFSEDAWPEDEDYAFNDIGLALRLIEGRL